MGAAAAATWRVQSPRRSAGRWHGHRSCHLPSGSAELRRRSCRAAPHSPGDEDTRGGRRTPRSPQARRRPNPHLLQGGAQQPDPQVPPCSPGPGIATAGQAGGGCRGSGDGPVAGVRPGLPPGLAVAPSRGVTREEAREEGAVAWESGGGLTPAPPHAGLCPHLEPQAGTARGCSRAGGKRCPLHGVPGHGQTLPLTASLLPARPGPLGLARRGHEGRATHGPRELESFLAAFPRS